MFEHGEAETDVECRPVAVVPHRHVPHFRLDFGRMGMT